MSMLRSMADFTIIMPQKTEFVPIEPVRPYGMFM